MILSFECVDGQWICLCFQFFLNEWWIQLNFVDFNIHIFLFCFITLKVKFFIDFHIFSVFFFFFFFWGKKKISWNVKMLTSPFKKAFSVCPADLCHEGLSSSPFYPIFSLYFPSCWPSCVTIGQAWEGKFNNWHWWEKGKEYNRRHRSGSYRHTRQWDCKIKRKPLPPPFIFIFIFWVFLFFGARFY